MAAQKVPQKALGSRKQESFAHTVYVYSAQNCMGFFVTFGSVEDNELRNLCKQTMLESSNNTGKRGLEKRGKKN